MKTLICYPSSGLHQQPVDQALRHPEIQPGCDVQTDVELHESGGLVVIPANTLCTINSRRCFFAEIKIKNAAVEESFDVPLHALHLVTQEN